MSKVKFVCFCLALVFCASQLSYGAWYFNDEFCTPCPKGVITQADPAAAGFIIEASSQFLQSHSSVFLLLNVSELNLRESFDFETAQKLIDSSIIRLSLSRENFVRVVNSLENLPIKPDIAKKFKSFNYSQLANKRNLHPDVMNKVAGFLKRADIKGIYEASVVNIDQILNALQQIQATVQSRVVPDIENLRVLFQLHSDSMLFGYYSSLVFYELQR